jgi:hypothetical protein
MKWLENTKTRRGYPDEHQYFRREVPGEVEREAPDGETSIFH